MVTDTKTEQVNSFLGGMNTDTSDYLLDPKLYREAHNLRFITDKDSDSGDFRLIEGGVMINNEIDGLVIASTSIRDYGILIVVDDEHKWSIVLLNKDGSKKDTPFGPCETPIWNGDNPSKANLSLTTKYESEANIKLYIADGIHKLMSLNIIRLDKSNTPNNIKDLTGDVEENLPFFEVSITNGGTLKVGIVQYVYNLYKKYGSLSKLSPVSSPQIISGDNRAEGKISNKLAKITINLSNSNISYYDSIKLYRISYESYGLLPIVNLVYDDYINNGILGSDFLAYDRGVNISTITVGELNSIAGVDLIPETISLKNNILFGANIKYIYNLYASEWDRGQKSSLSSLEIGIYENIKWEIILKEEIIDNSPKESYTNIEPYSIDELVVYNLMRGETYRYGIIFYSKDGSRSSVKYIDDIEIPTNIGIIETKEIDGVEKSFGINIGIQFTLLTIPNNCCAFEIVRCERTLLDSKTIAQGAISYTAKCVDAANSTYDGNSQMPFITTDYSIIGEMYSNSISLAQGSHITDINTVQFISPEVTFNSDSVLDVLKHEDCYIDQSRALAPYRTIQQLFTAYVPEHGESDVTFNIMCISNNGIFPFVKDGKNNIFGAGSVVKIFNDGTLGVYEVKKYGETGLLQDIFYFGLNGLYYRQLYYDNYNEIKLRTVGNENIHYHNNYCYIKYNTAKNIYNTLSDVKVENSALANNEYWDSVIKDGVQLFTLNITIVGDSQYINYVVGPWLNTSNTSAAPLYAFLNPEEAGNLINNWAKGCLIGIGGVSLLMKIDGSTMYRDNNADNVTDTLPMRIYNLKHNCVPYGGTTKRAIDESIFYGHGCYKKIDNDNTSDNDNASIDVFDGDTFVQMYEHVHVHKWHSIWDCGPTMSVIYSFPVETRINLRQQYGTIFSKIHNSNYASWIQKEPAVILGGDSASGGNVVNYTQEEPMYLYNHAYSMDMTAIKYAILSEDELKNTDYDCRIVYSNVSEQNETIDKFKIFQSANYIDVDTRYGAITELLSFKNGLFFWQENAFGALSVNEKQLIQNPDDTTLMLGTGDVLLRYDYVTTEYGMNPNEFVDTQGNNYLYWFDHNRRELLQYSIGGQIQPLSKEKGLTTYMRNVSVNDKPSITFDNKYDEVLLSTDNEIMVYNSAQQLFTSIYDTTFNYSIPFDDRLMLIRNDKSGNDKVCMWNKSEDNLSYGIGEEYLMPSVKYVVNSGPQNNKVFDTITFGGRFYGGGEYYEDKKEHSTDTSALEPLQFIFKTPLKQEGRILGGKGINNRDYDFRVDVPRAGKEVKYGNDTFWKTEKWGDRLKGKFMQCELSSTSNSLDFSLQYINTKFRLSWI